MKFGLRLPNPKKSFKAKTTGKMTRAAKKLINRTYGKKGIGIIKKPKKAMYNMVYNRTTVSLKNVVDGKENKKTENNYNVEKSVPKKYTEIPHNATKNRYIFLEKEISLLRGIGYFFLIAAIFSTTGENSISPWIVKPTYFAISFALLYFTSKTTMYKNNKSLDFLNNEDYEKAEYLLNEIIEEEKANLKTYEILFYFYLDRIKDFESVEFFRNKAIDLGSKDEFIINYNKNMEQS